MLPQTETHEKNDGNTKAPQTAQTPQMFTA